jgi:hypothetical protein
VPASNDGLADAVVEALLDVEVVTVEVERVEVGEVDTAADAVFEMDVVELLVLDKAVLSYTISAFGPPQSSDEFEEHTILQDESEIFATLSVLPQ